MMNEFYEENVNDEKKRFFSNVEILQMKIFIHFFVTISFIFFSISIKFLLKNFSIHLRQIKSTRERNEWEFSLVFIGF